jgi:uncharacterized membrane protein YdjX (TVP38/TMEM64 family)
MTVWSVTSWATQGIVWQLLTPEIAAEATLDMLRAFFDSWGIVAPVIYVLIVVVEVVVAPIPGTMLYLPGGVIFGGFWGGLLSLVGNVIGSGIACTIIRTLAGRNAVEALSDQAALDKYQRYIEKRGLAIIAFLRMNPLTSSDIVSYAAGLTLIPVWKVMAGTCLGMAPLCFLQAYLAEELFTALPWLVWPLVLLCVAYAVTVIVVMLKLRGKVPVTSATDGPA